MTQPQQQQQQRPRRETREMTVAPTVAAQPAQPIDEAHLSLLGAEAASATREGDLKRGGSLFARWCEAARRAGVTVGGVRYL